jgi:hypothetical protein
VWGDYRAVEGHIAKLRIRAHTLVVPLPTFEPILEANRICQKNVSYYEDGDDPEIPAGSKTIGTTALDSLDRPLERVDGELARFGSGLRWRRAAAASAAGAE